MTLAENYKNWWTCVKAIASQTSDIFLRHSVIQTVSAKSQIIYSMILFVTDAIL